MAHQNSGYSMAEEQDKAVASCTLTFAFCIHHKLRIPKIPMLEYSNTEWCSGWLLSGVDVLGEYGSVCCKKSFSCHSEWEVSGMLTWWCKGCRVRILFRGNGFRKIKSVMGCGVGEMPYEKHFP